MYYHQWTHGGHLFEFKNSSFDAVEKIYVDGKLVAAQASIMGTKHKFIYNGMSYEVRVRMNASFGVNISFYVNRHPIFTNHLVGTSISASYSPLKSKGRKLLAKYDVDEAIKAFNSALNKYASDAEIHFLLACCYSLNEDVAKAIYHIQYFLNNQPQDIAQVKTHDMLAYLRMQDEFQVLLEKYEN